MAWFMQCAAQSGGASVATLLTFENDYPIGRQIAQSLSQRFNWNSHAAVQVCFAQRPSTSNPSLQAALQSLQAARDDDLEQGDPPSRCCATPRHPTASATPGIPQRKGVHGPAGLSGPTQGGGVRCP